MASKHPPTDCPECGQIFKPRCNNRGWTRFCSMKCAGLDRRRRTANRRARKCEHCAKPFVSESHNRQRFCCKGCAGEARKQRTNSSPFNHGIYGYARHGCRCETCSAAKARINARRREKRLASLAYTDPKPDARCKRCRLGIVHDIKHGRTGWDRCGCRCDTCYQAQREHGRSWADAHRERVNATARRAYWTDHKKHLKRQRAWKSKNREKLNQTHRAKYRENPQFFREKSRIYREQNSEKWAQYSYPHRPRTPEQRLRQRQQQRDRNAKIPSDRNGQPWSRAEDAIAVRPDLTQVEKMFILHRTKSSIDTRAWRLRGGVG